MLRWALISFLISIPVLPAGADANPPVADPVPLTAAPPPTTPEQIKAAQDLKDHREAVRQADEDYQSALQTSGKASVEAKDAKVKLNEEHKDLEKTTYEEGKVRWPGPTAKVTSEPKSPAPNSADPMPPARQIEF